MTVQETLVTLLTGEGLKAYPLSVPVRDAVYPNVVYQTISNRQIRSHAGVEMERPRMQLSCWARTYSACVATAQTVKSAMDLNQVDFKLATKENEFDVKEVEPGLYRTVLDYFVWHTEGV
jgi:tRNA threonylcarbamoyladenosine modification (KEOPS) complex  Pcc1 subunit